MTSDSNTDKRSVKKVSSSSKGGWGSVPKGSIREGTWGSGTTRSDSTSSRGGWATSWETRRPPQGRTWSERLKPRHDRHGPNGSIAKAKRAREKLAKEQWAKEKVAIVQMVMGDSKGADMMGDPSMHYYRAKLYLHNNGQISTERHARGKLVVGDCKGADELCGQV